MPRERVKAEVWPVERLGRRKFFREEMSLAVVDEADDRFHIGQIYQDTAAATLRCKDCGGDEFNVGQGSHFTAIRCVKCEWEECIHDG